MHGAPARRIARYAAAALAFAGPALAGPLDSGTRLCLHAPRLPIANAAEDPRTADVQARLVAALEAADFTVRNAPAIDDLIERARERTGSIIDPYTGRVDRARYEARRGAIASSLETELGCEVRMSADVVPVYVWFSQGIARWEEQTDSVNSGGRWALEILGGVSYSGFVQGLVLWLRVLDLKGEEIAFRSAGIEVLVEFGVVRDKDLLPEDRWLVDAKKIDAAIASALGERGAALRSRGNPHWQPASH